MADTAERGSFDYMDGGGGVVLFGLVVQEVSGAEWVGHGVSDVIIAQVLSHESMRRGGGKRHSCA